MAALTENIQILSGRDGRPAFVVMPYEDYMASFDAREDIYVPNEVVKKQALENMTPMAAWRKHLGINQIEMAKRLGITQSSYSVMEKAEQPKKKTLERVASALGINVEQLVY